MKEAEQQRSARVEDGKEALSRFTKRTEDREPWEEWSGREQSAHWENRGGPWGGKGRSDLMWREGFRLTTSLTGFLIETCVPLWNVNLRTPPGLRTEAIVMTCLRGRRDVSRRIKNIQGSTQTDTPSVQFLAWRCVCLNESRLELLLGGRLSWDPFHSPGRGPTIVHMLMPHLQRSQLLKCRGDCGPLSL